MFVETKVGELSTSEGLTWMLSGGWGGTDSVNGVLFADAGKRRKELEIRGSERRVKKRTKMGYI